MAHPDLKKLNGRPQHHIVPLHVVLLLVVLVLVVLPLVGFPSGSPVIKLYSE